MHGKRAWRLGACHLRTTCHCGLLRRQGCLLCSPPDGPKARCLFPCVLLFSFSERFQRSPPCETDSSHREGLCGLHSQFFTTLGPGTVQFIMLRWFCICALAPPRDFYSLVTSLGLKRYCSLARLVSSISSAKRQALVTCNLYLRW